MAVFFTQHNRMYHEEVSSLIGFSLYKGRGCDGCRQLQANSHDNLQGIALRAHEAERVQTIVVAHHKRRRTSALDAVLFGARVQARLELPQRETIVQRVEAKSTRAQNHGATLREVLFLAARANPGCACVWWACRVPSRIEKM
jgi:hypothetical protein